MKRKHYFTILIALTSLLFLLSFGCSGKGDSGTSVDLSKTSVKGKVLLSGSVAGNQKPGFVAFDTAVMNSKAASGTIASTFLPGSEMNKVLEAIGAPGAASPLANATVELYDADHPEWIYPVAIALSDAQGNYELSVLANADENDAPYTNGDPIPAGNYTVIASKFNTNVGKLFVGVQAVVRRFSGPITGNDLQAPDSDAIPRTAFMFGKPSNSDGNFGGLSQEVPVNAAIPITFSMPMARLRAIEAISVTDEADGSGIPGTFKISPDLLTVTFIPDAQWTLGHTYSVKVLGGKSQKAAKNIYGIPTAATVYGRFTALAVDDTPSTVYPISPATTTNVPIITPIRIAATEPLDVNTFSITSDPGIGDKPFVRYVGYFKMTIGGSTIDSFVYEIVPSVPLQIDANYQIKVSDARDMAGNPLPTTPITFKTESTSAGITATDDLTRGKQIAVKDVFGKWLNALNSRNTSMLTTYMTGDFFWLSPGNSRDDLNRDGRLSLNEFTSMLENWFKDLERCGTVVSGDIVDDPASTADGINITGDKANITFSFTMTSSNTTDPSCQQGPPQNMYAELEALNGGWFMTRGSDVQVQEFPPSLTSIELLAPIDGKSYPEPTQEHPMLPEFSWLGVPGVTTYAVIVVDTRSRGWQTGWVGLVDGYGSADQIMKAQFSPETGYQGNVYVLQGHPAFGFNQWLEFKPGGTYYWAVLGLRDLDIPMFNAGFGYQANLKPYLVASSGSFNLDAQGVWKELYVSVKDGNGSVYPYIEDLNGYNVGSNSQVYVTVTSPDNTGGLGLGTYYVSGSQQWQSGNITFNSAGQGEFPLTLSTKQNYVEVYDRSTGQSLYKTFNIYTTGGIPPKIRIDNITPKKCDGTPAVWAATPWGSYSSTEVCSVDIDGHVTDLAITDVWAYVSGYTGWYDGYNTPVPVSSGFFTLTDIPVYKGWNRVEIYDLNSYQNVNFFTVDTSAGAIRTEGVLITSVTSTQSSVKEMSRGSYEVWADAGSADVITVSGISYEYAGCPGCYPSNYYVYAPPVWTQQSSGTLVLDSQQAFTQQISLVNGWNVVEVQGPTGGARVMVYTTGGSPLQLPHKLTKISDEISTQGIVPLETRGYYRYDAGASCTVTIEGQTDYSGQMYVYMNSTDSAGRSYYENFNVNTVGAGAPYSYTVTKNVYQGINTIDIYDPQWLLRGVQVTSSCPNSPVSIKVSSVSDGVSALAPDYYGRYRTESQLITIRGTAKAGKVVTARYYDGSQYKAFTTIAAAGDAFSISIPLPAGRWTSVSLNDGYTYDYIYIYSSYGTQYRAPVYQVRVGGAAAASGGLDTDSWGAWPNVTTASIAITARSKDSQIAWAMKGGYNSATGMANAVSWDSITQTYGYNFSVSLDVGVNYITLSDMNGGAFYMTVTTTAGATQPNQKVMITSPGHGASGTYFTVVGSVDTANFGAPVGTVYGYVYDYAYGRGVYFSSNPDDVKNRGYRQLTYDASGSFLFSFNSYSTSYKVMLEVYAVDSSGVVSHGHTIWLNTAGYPSNQPVTESFFKPAVSTGRDETFLREMDVLKMLKK